MSDERDDWTPREREAIRSLPSEEAPPDWLLERVVGEMKARGLVRAPRSPRWRLMAVSALAASIALFAAGLAVGSRLAPAPAPAPDTEPRFLLLLYEDAGYQKPPPGEESGRVEEYRGWARGLRKRGTLMGGEKLRPSGTIVQEEAGRAVAEEGEPETSAGALAGYFMIAAPDAEAALAIARDCPHLKHRGRIAIREIDPV